jgi:GR25 family glycosyltransferase involved in LPS biosynthesis
MSSSDEDSVSNLSEEATKVALREERARRRELEGVVKQVANLVRAKNKQLQDLEEEQEKNLELIKQYTKHHGALGSLKVLGTTQRNTTTTRGNTTTKANSKATEPKKKSTTSAKGKVTPVPSAVADSSADKKKPPAKRAAATAATEALQNTADSSTSSSSDDDGHATQKRRTGRPANRNVPTKRTRASSSSSSSSSSEEERALQRNARARKAINVSSSSSSGSDNSDSDTESDENTSVPPPSRPGWTALLPVSSTMDTKKTSITPSQALAAVSSSSVHRAAHAVAPLAPAALAIQLVQALTSPPPSSENSDALLPAATYAVETLTIHLSPAIVARVETLAQVLQSIYYSRKHDHKLHNRQYSTDTTAKMYVYDVLQCLRHRVSGSHRTRSSEYYAHSDNNCDLPVPIIQPTPVNLKSASVEDTTMEDSDSEDLFGDMDDADDSPPPQITTTAKPVDDNDSENTNWYVPGLKGFEARDAAITLLLFRGCQLTNHTITSKEAKILENYRNSNKCNEIDSLHSPLSVLIVDMVTLPKGLASAGCALGIALSMQMHLHHIETTKNTQDTLKDDKDDNENTIELKHLLCYMSESALESADVNSLVDISMNTARTELLHKCLNVARITESNTMINTQATRWPNPTSAWNILLDSKTAFESVLIVPRLIRPAVKAISTGQITDQQCAFSLLQDRTTKLNGFNRQDNNHISSTIVANKGNTGGTLQNIFHIVQDLVAMTGPPVKNNDNILSEKFDIYGKQLHQRWHDVLDSRSKAHTTTLKTDYCDFTSITRLLRNASRAYNSEAQGWHLSKGGSAVTLEERAIDRMQKIQEQLDIAAIRDGLPPNPAPKPQGNISNWAASSVIEHTSIKADTLARLGATFDAAWDAVNSLGICHTGSEEGTLQSRLSTYCVELASIVFMVRIEVFMYMIATSARTYLQVIEELDYPYYSSTDSMYNKIGLVPDAIHALRILPAPWGLHGGGADAHLTTALLHAHTRYTRAISSHILSSNNNELMQSMTNTSVMALSQCIPALVINLHRRQDRWRTIKRMCRNVDIAAMPLRAVDGKLVFNSHQSNTIEGIALQACIDRDICQTWDSTLNHEYDRMCYLSHDVPMTQSERACAASHVRAWRRIASIRHALYNVNLPNNGLHDEGTDSSGSVFENDEIQQLEEEKDYERAGISLAAATEALYRVTVSGGGCEPYVGSNPVRNNSNLIWPRSYSTPPPSSTTSSNASSNRTIANTSSNHNTGPDFDWYLILEDDASLSPEITKEPLHFKRILSQCLQSVPDDWDMLYLGYAASKKGRGPMVNKSACGMTGMPRSISMFHARYMWQLHGYLLRGKAVHKLLDQLPVKGPVDNFIASLTYDNTIIAYGLSTPIIIQPGSFVDRQADSDVRHSGRGLVVKDKEQQVSVNATGTGTLKKGISRNVRFKKGH